MNKKTNGKILKIDRNRKLEILCRIDTYTTLNLVHFLTILEVFSFSNVVSEFEVENHLIIFILHELKAEEVKMLMLASLSGQNSDHRLVYCWCFVTRQKMVTDT